MMKKSNLKIIEGGIRPKEECKKIFISSYITDTRLMGAMGMFVRWEVLDCRECDDLLQFFYFDTEEFGLESYQSIWGYDKTRMLHIEHTTIGCLGGKKIPLTEKEVCAMVKHYHNMTVANGISLPKEHYEYDFILSQDCKLTPEEEKTLINKICTPVISDQQAAHYFMMRVFGRDQRGALYLCDETFDKDNTDLFPHFKPSTMFKNTFTIQDDYCICESLINEDEQYFICTSKLKLKNCKVLEAKAISSFAISQHEAAMILNRTEYVSVYEMISEDILPPDAALELSFNTTCSFHSNGKLIMAFKENNDHVNEDVFLLNNDIYGTYFITPLGQFVLTANSLENIKKLENNLSKSSVGPFLMSIGKFAFREAITGDFIGSDFYDFMEFIDTMDLS